MIVSDAAVRAFITILGMVGAITVDQVRDDYEAEAGRAWLAATAGVPRADWLQKVQMSTVADALPDAEDG